MLVALTIIWNSGVSPQSINFKSEKDFFNSSAFSFVLLLIIIFDVPIFFKAKIIEDTTKEAKSIIEDSRKKLENDIENKKQKFNEEIEKELMIIEKEIKALKKSSISNINKIAVEISSEIIKQIVGTEINKSNVSAIVEGVSKRKVERYLWI